MANKPSTKKQQEQEQKRQRIMTLVLALLLVLALAAISVLTLFMTGVIGGAGEGEGKEEQRATFIVTHGNTAYTKDSSGLILYSGDEVKLTPLEDKAEFIVLIVANGETDFELEIGEEPWRWAQLAGKDFTRGFTVTRTSGGFSIKYGTLEDIISTVMYMPATVSDGISFEHDFFTLIVTDGQTKIELGFRISARVGSVTVGPDITFEEAIHETI